MKRTKLFLMLLPVLLLLLGGCTLPPFLHMEGIDLESLPIFDQPTPTPEPSSTPIPEEDLTGAAGEVRRFFAALAGDDRSVLRSYCGDELPGYTTAQPTESRTIMNLYRGVYDSISYRIGAVTENNVSATVGVEITALDMRAVMSALREDLEALVAGEDYRSMSAREREVAYAELLEARLAAAEETVTKKVTLGLRGVNGEWTIGLDSEVRNALTGGLVLALRDFDVPEMPAEDEPLTDQDKSSKTYLVAYDACTVLVTGIRPNGPEGYTLDIHADNHSRQELVFSVHGCTVDGYVMDPDFSLSVPGRASADTTLTLRREKLAACGITSVWNIEFRLDVFEKPAWPVYPLISVPCALHPLGRDNGPAPRMSTETENVLLDDGVSVVSVLSTRSEGCWGYEMQLYLENNTGEELWFSLGEEQVNGVLIDPGWSQAVPAGKRAVETVRWTAGALMEQSISEADQVDFRLYVSSLNDLDKSGAGYSAGGHFVLKPEE